MQQNQATKFTVKNVAQQNFLAVGDTASFSCDL